MKIYISMDMEGVAGTFNWEQEKGKDWAEVRKNMCNQVEWVVEGIRASPVNGQIDEILVADSHARGDTIPYDITALDDRLHLVSGAPRPQSMMPALSGDFSVVFLVGYHAGKGLQRSSMDHTYSSASIHRIWVNENPMNEALLNAALAGSRGVPVGLVIGDESLRRQLESEQALGEARFVVTKEALSRFSAKSRPMGVVRRETIEAVEEVLSRDLASFTPFTVESPVRLTIELTTTGQADVVSFMPGIERIDGLTVQFVHEEYGVVFDALQAIMFLASRGRLGG